MAACRNSFFCVVVLFFAGFPLQSYSFDRLHYMASFFAFVKNLDRLGRCLQCGDVFLLFCQNTVFVPASTFQLDVVCRRPGRYVLLCHPTLSLKPNPNEGEFYLNCGELRN